VNHWWFFWLVHVTTAKDHRKRYEPEEYYDAWASRLAYLSRYGRLDVQTSARLPMRFLDAFERGLVKLLESEGPQEGA
jgi:hypothetical protein